MNLKVKEVKLEPLGIEKKRRRTHSWREL